MLTSYSKVIVVYRKGILVYKSLFLVGRKQTILTLFHGQLLALSLWINKFGNDLEKSVGMSLVSSSEVCDLGCLWDLLRKAISDDSGVFGCLGWFVLGISLGLPLEDAVGVGSLWVSLRVASCVLRYMSGHCVFVFFFAGMSLEGSSGSSECHA